MGKILVIDDEEVIRKTVKKYLEIDDYQVITAANGQEGIEAFLEERPDVVLTDLKMPGMDGLAVVKAIKGLDKDAEVIVVTGHGDIDAAVESLKLRASDFILKPVDIEELEKVVERSLEKRALKRQIKKAQMFNRSIMDSATDFSIITCDHDGNIISWNRGAVIIMGYAEEEAAGKMHISDIFPPDLVKSGALEKIANRILSGKRYEEEIYLKRKNSDIFPAALNASALNDENGIFLGMLAIVQDITHRKRTEKELKRAKTAAEAANMVKSEFLANMSHEIRTPMNGVIGMTDLALDTNLTDEQRGYLKVVKSSANNLLNIINDILDFSKVEAGRLEIEEIDFRLRTTIDSIMEQMAFKASPKDLELISYIGQSVPDAVIGDPGRLRQVIINLLGNSIKFTDEGEIFFQVKVAEKLSDSVELLFSISDTGLGIPEERREAIFKSFTQANGSTTRKYGGTGLGTTISKQLIELMGGKIWIENSRLSIDNGQGETNNGQLEIKDEKSKRGPGTTFSFTLSFNLQKEKDTPVLHGNAQVDIKGLKVLVVDDNYFNRLILNTTLKKWGLIPDNASCGQDALEAIRISLQNNSPYSIIFLDYQMPDINGFLVAKKIQEKGWLKYTRIIMLTSVMEKGHSARCMELNISSYISKPVSQSLLFDAIVKTMGGHKNQNIITPHTTREEGKRLKILLAEDNRVNQILAKKLLEKQGHSVIIAENGLLALEALEKENYDLVLMDIQMPVMTGTEATINIRKRERQTTQSPSHVPIIAMTAHSMRGDKEKFIKAGMDDYVSKPIIQKDLFDAIERTCKS